MAFQFSTASRNAALHDHQLQHYGGRCLMAITSFDPDSVGRRAVGRR